MWYYSLNNQPVGPIDEAELKALFARGVINFDTLIWREGMPEWKRYGEITMVAPGISPVSQLPAANVPMVEPGGPSRRGLKSLYLWWLITTLFTAVFMVFFFWLESSMLNGMDTAVLGGLSALMCVGYIPVLASVVLEYVLIYKLWKVVQDGFASTSAGKAVGFLFIPLFNYYWLFRAFWGLSKDYNRFIDRHFANRADLEVRRSASWISLTYLIFMFGGGIIYYIIYMGTIGSQILANNFSGSLDTSSMMAMMGPVFIYMAIYFVVQMVLVILMFADFHKTADSILAAEEHV
jgi:hypothetical protein